jgi:hypothetical protein
MTRDMQSKQLKVSFQRTASQDLTYLFNMHFLTLFLVKFPQNIDTLYSYKKNTVFLLI